MFAEPAPSPPPLPLHPAAFDRALRDAILDTMDAGVIVCDADGHVLFRNLAARQELETARLLQVTDGRLRAPVNPAALGSALAAAVDKGTRHVVDLRSGDDRLYTVVCPLQSSSGDRMAVVLLGRRTSSSELSIELLGISAGLTAAERRVLADLASQRKPTRIARERDVTIATVRTQISSLYAKLDVRSQQELLCLVGGVPPLATRLFAG